MYNTSNSQNQNEQNNDKEVELIDDLVDKYQSVQIFQISDVIVDFVLKCIKGPYLNRFIYINLTSQGELIGSDISQNLTLLIENAGLEKKHCEVRYISKEQKYILRDLSEVKGTWIELKPEFPEIINNQIWIKIENDSYLIQKIEDENDDFNEVQQWLKRIDLERLEQFFRDSGINSIEDIYDMNIDFLKTLDLNEVEQKYLEFAIEQVNEDFVQGYQKHKLGLYSQDDLNESFLEIGWSGAFIGTFKNADLYIQQDSRDQNKQKYLEIGIKYEYGQYWLLSSKMNERKVYFRLQEPQILFPDDVIQIGELDFRVQRFNTGYYETIGHRHSMEDVTVIRQELKICNKMSISLYAIFDGHGNQDCVRFVASNIVDYIRDMASSNYSLQSEANFYEVWKTIILECFKKIDDNFFNDFKDLSLYSGACAMICLVIGNKLVTVNLGDSRAILSRNGQIVRLSYDQKPQNPSEKERIEAAGGTISNDRLLGKLAVSRALGDFAYKKMSESISKYNYDNDLISSIPEIRVHEIDYVHDEFMVLSCDGLYEQFTKEEIIDFVRTNLGKEKLMQQDPMQVAQKLVNEALDRANDKKKKSDNISVVIVCLNRGVIIK